MGTKVAPTYATLVLSYLETQLYHKLEGKFSRNFRIHIEENWKRFLDDCFLLWTLDNENFQKLHQILNSLNADLSFTTESDTEKLSFLDVLIKCDEGLISTDIFYKPTDTKQYLMYTSCQPKHTKNNIPFNLARRICSNVSDRITLEVRLSELKQFLINRRNPENLIDIGIEKAKAIPKQQLRQQKSDKINQETLSYISTFNPKNPETFSLIYNRFPMLQTDERLKRILEETL